MRAPWLNRPPLVWIVIAGAILLTCVLLLWHVATAISTSVVGNRFCAAIEDHRADDALRLLRNDPSLVSRPLRPPMLGSVSGYCLAVHVAAGTADARMLEEICKRGDWANARDSKGETPLGWLLTFGDTESAEAQSKALSVLINHGADVNLPTDADGYAPLHSAVVNPRSAIIAKLLHEGAKASTTMSDGTTPLHMLFMYVGQYELRETIESAKLLIAAGADINAPNSSGTTPVDTIKEYNKPEIAKALLTAVADAEHD